MAQLQIFQYFERDRVTRNIIGVIATFLVRRYFGFPEDICSCLRLSLIDEIHQSAISHNVIRVHNLDKVVEYLFNQTAAIYKKRGLNSGPIYLIAYWLKNVK
jgi:hypothetical protein